MVKSQLVFHSAFNCRRIPFSSSFFFFARLHHRQMHMHMQAHYKWRQETLSNNTASENWLKYNQVCVQEPKSCELENEKQNPPSVAERKHLKPRTRELLFKTNIDLRDFNRAWRWYLTRLPTQYLRNFTSYFSAFHLGTWFRTFISRDSGIRLNAIAKHVLSQNLGNSYEERRKRKLNLADLCEVAKQPHLDELVGMEKIEARVELWVVVIVNKHRALGAIGDSALSTQQINSFREFAMSCSDC